MKHLVYVAMIGLLAAGAQAREVVEPAGSIPVVQDVDVVVVGGAAGGVEAALAAAKQGAKVFLVAPRPYLGEDICATYRLWLEPGEVASTALAQDVFKPQPLNSGVGPGLPFTYTANVATSGKHADTKPPSLLHDGKWAEASQESVQYNGNVTLTIDLGKVVPISKLSVLVYQRPEEFAVEKIAVSASRDGRTWQPVTTIANDKLDLGTVEDEAMPLSAAVQMETRYLKLAVQKTELSTRLLLGEVIVEGATAAEPPPAANRLQPVTPMQVKRTLDQALIKANIPFLYSCGVSDLLRDASGQPAGVIIANRSGQQAVRAKVIIDATDRANVARLAGAQFAPYPAETQIFRRTVVGGPVRESDLTKVVTRATPLTITDKKGTVYPLREYEVPVSMASGDWKAFATAEQMARDVTWTKEAVDASEMLFQVPPDACHGTQSAPGAWQSRC